MNRRGFLRTALAGASLIALPRFAWSQPHEESDRFANVSLVDANLTRHPTLASTSNAPVGIQLSLGIDTSGSISDEELAIELQATAYALNSQLVRTAIKYKIGENSVAVNVFDFDGTGRLRVPWVDIRSEFINDKPFKPEDPENSSDEPDVLDALCREIAALPRRGEGGTELHRAVDFSRQQFLVCPWQAVERRVLDLFGDGSSNAGSVQGARDRLAGIGGTINAFAIVNDEANLETFFRENLVTRNYTQGPDGVWSEPGRVWAVARNMQDNNNDVKRLRPFFEEVARGMKQKISVELAGLDNYNRALDRLGQSPDFPLPRLAIEV